MKKSHLAALAAALLLAAPSAAMAQAGAKGTVPVIPPRVCCEKVAAGKRRTTLAQRPSKN